MKNPFEYGGIVSGKAFCNRKREIADLLRSAENNEKLLIFSERRMGKTSLVQVTLEKLAKKQYVTAYIDLWPTDGEASFITTTAKSIIESMSTTTEKLLSTAKKFFSRLVPNLTVDDDGKPMIVFGVNKHIGAKPALEEVLNAPAKIAAKSRRKVVVVFDEFQQILEYGSDSVERRLRSIIQKHANVSYFFLGSRKHLLQKLFLDKSRPLYRMAGHYPLRIIEEKYWLPFIRKRFLDAEKRITDEQISSVCRLTQGHPFYTQHLCHALWELCEVDNEVSGDLIEAAVQLLLDRENYAYSTLWETITLNQRRFLIGLAEATIEVKPFGSDFIQRYQLRSASNVQRSAESLLERDVIDFDNGSYIVADRFFRIWIQRMQIIKEIPLT